MDELGSRHEVLSARRRLLRGTFAVPAVAALHSGSALAASSNLHCIQQRAASPVYPGFTNAPDVYVRVQLHQLWREVPGTGTPLGWYLSGNSVEAIRLGERRVTNSLLRAGLWQKVELHGRNARLSATPLSVPPGPPTRLVPGPCWVALRVVPVRDRGWRIEIVGLVDGNTTGTAIAGSCWTSFAVA
jgi:hypothetical protein